MSFPATAAATPESHDSAWDRLGIPKALLWGFLGLTLFMIGDGVETNILEPYLSSEQGFTVASAGTLVMVYGIAVAIAAFFAAALSDLWGPRKVMALGAAIWVVFELLLLLVALPSSNTLLIFIVYGLRGFGYPLFAYAFLVWITAVSPVQHLATGVGWFYVSFSAGLPTLGALVATLSISVFDFSFYETFWVSLVLVLIGTACVLLGVKERIGRAPLVDDTSNAFVTVGAGLLLLAEDRRARFVTYIRTINSVPTYAMAIFFPAFFTERLGWPLSWFLILTSVIYAVNLPFNPINGRLGDRIGWRKSMFWFGSMFCAVTMALLYFVPLLLVDAGVSDNVAFGATLVAGALFGVALAGFVPLSPIAVALLPERPGAAMSAYNLGVGAAVAAGPALVAIFYPLIGATGLVIMFCILYVVSGLLTLGFKGLQPGFEGVPPLAEGEQLANPHASHAPAN